MNLVSFSALLFIFVLVQSLINAEHTYLNLRSVFDSSVILGELEDNQVPTLENLFQKPTYWDINNVSSPCKHSDYKRNFLCQKIVTFDRDGYEKSLQDTRKLFLGRLELSEEPAVRMNTNQLKFLGQVEQDIELEEEANGEKVNSIIKTKYDMKSSSNLMSNSMHEALVVNNCEGIIEQSDSLLCLDFEVPMKNLLGRTHDHRQHFHKISSVTLWFHIQNKIQRLKKVKMEILNLKYSKKAILFYESELQNGWNTLDVKDIFRLPQLTDHTQNTTLKLTLLLKCLFDCKIQVSREDRDKFDEDSPNVIGISSSNAKRPVLSVNLDEKLDMDNKVGGDLMEPRFVSSTHSRSTRQLSVQKRYMASDYSSNLCKNNYPNSIRECCLITYFVDFNALKWSWILSPSGFLANYCSGNCNQKNSFQYASKYSQNAEVKLTYNDQLRIKSDYLTNEMMETCCHPVSMDSLVIKYIATNGSIISKVLPNMIITGCGCS